jgi:BirA family biotin operon repressor/biotin-[acetyl-CoA-carboxylase] ligase
MVGECTATRLRTIGGLLMSDRAPLTDVAASPFRLERHARIGSTNDRARSRLRQPDGAGVIVVADEQLTGRGRRGRSWASPPGRNLYLSLGLRPDLAARDAWQLSFGAALAVREACAPIAALWVKWPNDLVAADGAKVAGLLLETSVDGERVADAVVGIGINVNWRRAEMPAELRPRATSLAEQAGAPVDREALLARLATALHAEIGHVEAGDSPLRRYRAASWLTGRSAEVETGGERVAGTVRGFAPDGALLVEADGVIRTIGHGEVVRVLPAPAGAPHA